MLSVNKDNLVFYFLLYVELVSYGCYNKLQQTWWIVTTEIYSLIVLEAGSLKSVSLGQNQGVSRIALSLEAVEENSFLASSSFWWLLTFLDLWPPHSNICLCGHIASSSSVYGPPLCLPFIKIHVIVFRAHPVNPELSLHFVNLNLITHTEILFP